MPRPSPVTSLVSAYRSRGVGGLAAAAGHGVAWRCRRLRNRWRRFGRPQPVARPVAPPDDRLLEAERRLRSIETRALRPDDDPGLLRVGFVVIGGTDGLVRTLESVRAQTSPHWQCVVVDDARLEDIGEVVKPFRIADPRISLARHAAPGGPAAARNTGIRAIDSDVVTFLAAGDTLAPDAVEVIRATATRFWSDACVAGVVGRGPVAIVGRAPTAPFDWLCYDGSTPFPTALVAVRRELLEDAGGFDEALAPFDDRAVWLSLLRHGFRFEPSAHVVIPERVEDAPGTAPIEFQDAGLRTTRLDPRLARGPAGAYPVDEGRRTLVRARRLAAVLGARVAATGSLSAVDDAWPAPLDRARLLEARRPELVGCAIEGFLHRLGSPDPARLDVASRRTLALVGTTVADALFAVESDEQYDIVEPEPAPDVLLLAESIADVAELSALIGEVGSDVSVAAADLELLGGHSGANAAWSAAGVGIVPYHRAVDLVRRCGRVIACSPVGPVTGNLLDIARHAGVAVDALQPNGRPAPLDVSAATRFSDITRSPAALRASLSAGPIAPRRRVSPPRRSRGSGFPLHLPFEDGPIDIASIERLRALQNCRRGETAVIIGNGPSLNETELDLLTDVATFGVNGIFLAADRLPKPITFYVVEDTSVFKENLAEIKAVESEWKLFPAMYRSSFADHEVTDTTVFFRMNAGFYDRKTGTTGHPRFSLDATQRLYCGQSVTIINLQLAHWMGFREVVLIGMDFSYVIPEDSGRDGKLIVSKSADPNHFDPRYFGPGKTWKDPLLDRVLVSYHLVDEMYRATGRRIVNATVGGKLDLFPRASLREALGG